ncbi:MAG TPA: type II toxin-antitoxin system RelE/ParE family toxin [Longimicrobium sp.]|nr:type II toxin-antitoxin system RelE/ParE family toxin [Longimicrobium sp.]
MPPPDRESALSGYTLSPSAQRDLLEAAQYVAEESGNPELGDRIIDRLTAVMEKLTEFPAMGRSRDELRPMLRSFVSPPFLIFYRPHGDEIHIVRILHERRDIERAFPTRRPH